MQLLVGFVVLSVLSFVCDRNKKGEQHSVTNEGRM